MTMRFFVFIASMLLAGQGMTRESQNPSQVKNLRSRFVFASAQDAGSILTTNDDYTAALSPVDVTLRMSGRHGVATEEFFRFLSEQGVAWTDEEMSRIQSFISQMASTLSGLGIQPSLPDEVRLLKTSGREECGSAYTRQNAIILPASMMNSPDLKRILAHEIFHIMTWHAQNAHPSSKLKAKLYQAIGFSLLPRNAVSLPLRLKERLITNPDTVGSHAVITVTVNAGGRREAVLPILLSRVREPAIEPESGVFDILSFMLLRVQYQNSVWVPVQDEAGQPSMFRPDATDYPEQTRLNTDYNIHPEEILADNFALLATEQTAKLSHRETIEHLRTILMNESSK